MPGNCNVTGGNFLSVQGCELSGLHSQLQKYKNLGLAAATNCHFSLKRNIC
jgi:hypothetical protein